MRAAVVAALIVMGAATANAAPRPFPSTPEGNYDVGQTFAHCSAHWLMAAQLAAGLNLPETATAFGDTARGWKVAGMIFLAEGLSEEKQLQTAKVFDDLAAAKLQQLKAEHELHPDAPADSLTTAFQVECGEWVDTQRNLIAAMRRTLPTE